jgi:hypothetical protein
MHLVQPISVQGSSERELRLFPVFLIKGEEKNLKTISKLMICALLTMTIPGTLRAADRKFEKAIVVENHEHTKILPHRSKLTDAPPPATEFDHDITFRLGCTEYVARYRSEIDYLPPALTPGESVDISVEQNVMYARIPGNKDARMSIIRREQLKEDACGK